jgi:hypothetical protein
LQAVIGPHILAGGTLLGHYQKINKASKVV